MASLSFDCTLPIGKSLRGRLPFQDVASVTSGGSWRVRVFDRVPPPVVGANPARTEALAEAPPQGIGVPRDRRRRLPAATPKAKCAPAQVRPQAPPRPLEASQPLLHVAALPSARARAPAAWANSVSTGARRATCSRHTVSSSRIAASMLVNRASRSMPPLSITNSPQPSSEHRGPKKPYRAAPQPPHGRRLGETLTRQLVPKSAASARIARKRAAIGAASCAGPHARSGFSTEAPRVHALWLRLPAGVKRSNCIRL